MRDIQLGDLKYAIREHHATTKHWDFRFELNGVLLSWYSEFPPHLDPYKPIKLFRAPDHQLEYLLSERIIPEGQKGAGPTAVGDKGLYRFLGPIHRSVQLSCGNIHVDLNGQLLHGRFSLKRVGPHSKIWIWTKEWDNEVNPTFRFPPVLTPEKIKELGSKTRVENDLLPFFQGYPLNPRPLD